MIKNNKIYRWLHSGKSLTWICIRGFLVYLAIMALVYEGVSIISDSLLEHVLPDISDVLRYENKISRDQYDKIPKSAYQNCSLIVFDENGQEIFPEKETGEEKASEVLKTSGESKVSGELKITGEEKDAGDKKEIITADELDFIPDASEELVYEVLKNEDGSGWWIFRNKTVDGDPDEIVDYCVLDEDGKIVQGNLFSDKTVVTEREMRMLAGICSNDRNIVKEEVANQNGEKRTIVFIYPMASTEVLDQVWKKNNYLMMVYLGIAGVGVFILAGLLAAKIRMAMQPLNDIMDQYQNTGRCEEDRDKVVREYRGIVDRFAALTETIKAADQRRIEAEAEKNRMIMDLSHDLKTPLTVIQGYSQALSTGKVPEADQKKYMDVLRKKSDVSVQLINNLMQYATMEHPDYQINKEHKDICEVLRTLLIERYDEIETQGMELELAIPEEPVYYDVDVRIFGNLLDNLINNTIKYNQAGVTIFISLVKEEKKIVIEYADDGVGIPPEIRNSVFTPFVIGNQARTSVKGTGIGMSIVKRAVELHGGTIAVEEAGGSRFSVVFRIELPLVEK